MKLKDQNTENIALLSQRPQIISSSDRRRCFHSVLLRNKHFCDPIWLACPPSFSSDCSLLQLFVIFSPLFDFALLNKSNEESRHFRARDIKKSAHNCSENKFEAESMLEGRDHDRLERRYEKC